MPSKNGAAPIVALPAARRRVSAVPLTRVFEVEVLRGDETQVLELVGYHRERCPVWVQVQVDQAHREYVDQAYRDVTTTGADGKTVVDRQFRFDAEADARYHRDMLLAVVKGLEEFDADVLCSTDAWIEILADLGWWRAPAEDDASGPEATGGEATGQTGGASSPEPARSTAPTTG